MGMPLVQAPLLARCRSSKAVPHGHAWSRRSTKRTP